METIVSHCDGIITITDANTTIAYCRYDSSGEIEYLFVSPPFRRRGHAARMLDLVEERLNTRLRFNPPISPLGRHVVEAYSRRFGNVTI
jgi:ribosomal protein S18 acetylase RimI-like enzyme